MAASQSPVASPVPPVPPRVGVGRGSIERRQGRLDWLIEAWGVLMQAAVLAVLAFSPSSWSVDERRLVRQELATSTLPALVSFAAISALLSLVITRIVIVTAESYGLTGYALEMMVRVLALELIPLAAAMYAALRCTLPDAAEVAALRARQMARDQSHDITCGTDLLTREAVPRVVAGLVATLALALTSGVIALALTYVSVYGFTPSGLAAYTRTVGHVLSPAVTLIFALKAIGFGFAVALIPMASVLQERRRTQGRHTSAEIRGLVRMFLALLLIEAASLMGNYA